MSVEGTAAPHPGALPHPWCQWQNQCRWQLKVRPPTMSWGERAGGKGGEGGEGGAPTFPHPPGTYHGARSPSKTHRASWPPQRQLQEETGRAEERLLCRYRRVRRGRQEAAPEGGGGWSLKPRLLLAPATDGTEEAEGGPSGTWWVGTPHAGTGAPRSPARLPGASLQHGLPAWDSPYRGVQLRPAHWGCLRMAGLCLHPAPSPRDQGPLTRACCRMA